MSISEICLQLKIVAGVLLDSLEMAEMKVQVLTSSRAVFARLLQTS